MRVLLVGAIYQDNILRVSHFPDEDEKLRAEQVEIRLGGNIGNTARVLSQFPDTECLVQSSLASEAASSYILRELEDSHVNTQYCRFGPQSVNPSSYIIHSKATGSRTIVNYNDVTDLTLADLNMVPLDTIQWLHFEGRNVDNLIRMVLWMNEQSWRSNITISVEFEKPDRSTLEPLYDKVDVLFFSKPWAKARGAHSAYDFLHSMADRCKARAIAFCTWGSSPAAVMTKEDGNVKVSTIPVEQATEILDSVGAGDTFNAGVIHGLITGRDAREAAAFGCHLATRKVQQHGFSGLVNPDRTDNFVHPPLSNDYESLSCATGHTRRSSHHAH